DDMPIAFFISKTGEFYADTERFTIDEETFNWLSNNRIDLGRKSSLGFSKESPVFDNFLDAAKWLKKHWFPNVEYKTDEADNAFESGEKPVTEEYEECARIAHEITEKDAIVRLAEILPREHNHSHLCEVGGWYWKLGHRWLASMAYRRSIEILPEAATYFNLALCYDDMGAKDLTQEAMNKFFELVPSGEEQEEAERMLHQNGKDYLIRLDKKEALIGYRKAAEQGDSLSQYNLGKMYYYGHGVPQNYNEAVKWFSKAAEQGNAKAQYVLGLLYDNGEGIPQNDKDAIRWYTKAAEQGLAEAQHNLALMYEYGRGIPQNHKEAVKWYSKAAEQGISFAQYNLGLAYDTGQDVSLDYKEAAKWYLKAAKQGHAMAQNNLGVMYYKIHNHKEAVKWYSMAAEQGIARAQGNLAGMYYNGQGVPQNYNEAVKWYSMAAEQGEADAQHDLALMYENGNGVPQNYKEAVRWYSKAAKQGHAIAQSKLGLFFYKGQGISKDPVQAYKWFELAVTHGDKDAKKHRDTLKKKMSLDQLAEAQRLIREFKTQAEE
ncbi:MAG TPA: hypothetical protein PLN83_14195, partial [Syntrophorhabdus sp.]|nr:hypothetical protein [Syntrophorhabdus sp.]